MNRAPGVLFHRYNEYSRREIWKGGLKGDIRGHAATSERATATRSGPCINSQHHQRDTKSHSHKGCAPKPPRAPPDAHNDIITDTVHHRYTAAPFGYDYICNYLHNQLCILPPLLQLLSPLSTICIITNVHHYNSPSQQILLSFPPPPSIIINTAVKHHNPLKNCFPYYYILPPSR